MSQETDLSIEKRPSGRSKRIVGGGLLIVFGLGILMSYLSGFALWQVPLVGILMLVWAIFTRDSGWFIPAGVMNGIALGILALEGPWQLATGEPQSGALFLLCFASGWFSIPLFSVVFTRDKHLWALIPGGIMAFIGAAILLGSGGLKVLVWVSYLIPAALMLGGLALILKKKG